MGRLLLQGSATSLLEGRPWAALAMTALFGLAAAPPVIVLGAVGPYLVRAGLQRVEGAGEKAGSLSAASNLGSILGTLLAAFVLLPLLGTARTMGGLALVLGGTAALRLRWRWRIAAVGAPLAALLLAPLALPLHPRAMDFVESPYSLVQVLESAGGARELVFDEAYAVQSVWRAEGIERDEVFAHYLLAPSMRASAGSSPRVLLLGLGAGSSAQGLLQLYPDAQVVGVELDPQVVRLGRLHFGLPEKVEVQVADARRFLQTDRRTFDVIILDAFRFPYVPFHLTTLEFDQLLARHLAPGGVVCVNVGRYGEEKQVVHRVGATLAQVFPEVLAADARNHSNTLLFAGAPGIAERLRERTRAEATGPLRSLGLRVASELKKVSAGPALTDDLAPVEFLTDGILARALLQTGGRL